jgi:molecular chaperone DnaJ
MADKRDYYEVLGVGKNASTDDIKMAYRKLAMQWHPDRWVNGSDAEKKTAEEKFKEASEAYSVLSDPDKKAKYDQFGFSGVDGQPGPDFSGGFGNLNDILNDLFRRCIRWIWWIWRISVAVAILGVPRKGFIGGVISVLGSD